MLSSHPHGRTVVRDQGGRKPPDPCRSSSASSCVGSSEQVARTPGTSLSPRKPRDHGRHGSSRNGLLASCAERVVVHHLSPNAEAGAATLHHSQTGAEHNMGDEPVIISYPSGRWPRWDKPSPSWPFPAYAKPESDGGWCAGHYGGGLCGARSGQTVCARRMVVLWVTLFLPGMSQTLLESNTAPKYHNGQTEGKC